MDRKVIEIVDGVTRHPAYRMDKPIDFVLNEGEQLAIVGPNGSGKTMLVNTIIGRYPLMMNEVHYDFGEENKRMVCENIHYIAFRDSYGDHDPNYYYQQRWHSQDVELSPTVREQFELGVSAENMALRESLFRDFSIDALMDKLLVMLSSGELRRLQIVKALMTSPRVLIMDNPFIGLDAEMRHQLNELLKQLISERGLQLILVLSREDEVPDFITHVVPVYNKVVGGKIEKSLFPVATDVSCNIGGVASGGVDSSDGKDVIIELRNVTLRYGERVIFENFNWTVCRGERWALHGRNGSGKSALLSLICADNPQSYACDISLFGKRRGMGESIWDIKRRIGYVSPEMHRAYLKDLPSIEIVASGLHDSIGLYKRPRPEQMGVCKEWMRVFGIEELAERTFLTLSSGEQRLVLLARAFVKDPELFILDEPLHGLDTQRREQVRGIIDQFCIRPEKTLIMVTHYPEELPSCITHHKKL
ncbi:MAG: ATP-binding cassette domain-containing protein [Bacteroidaceae bacterium]|nr:ATP-binding cassette domain-containing protein [Bacteroidaceae bacterium]